MATMLGAPGALLILLRRDVASTRVLVRSDDTADDEPFVWAAAQSGSSQWELAERICSTAWANEVSRLYASTLSVLHEEERLGIFVGFLDEDADDAPPPPHCGWQDLRRASGSLPEPWGGLLTAVRARFVAQSPDDALRLR